MRLLGLASDAQGRDWDKLTRRIDHQLEVENFDLAEETVLIEFRKGEAIVYRPVIGGLKEVHAPFVLSDRVAGKALMKTLQGEFWDEILDEVDGKDCTLVIKRRLDGELKLSVEVFFSFF